MAEAQPFDKGKVSFHIQKSIISLRNKNSLNVQIRKLKAFICFYSLCILFAYVIIKPMNPSDELLLDDKDLKFSVLGLLQVSILMSLKL